MKTINYIEALQIFANTSANANKTYRICNIIDLGGNSLTLPSGCTLDFQGGYFTNGTLVGNNAIILTSKHVSDVLDCYIQDTFVKDGEAIYALESSRYIDSQEAFDTYVVQRMIEASSSEVIKATLASNTRFHLRRGVRCSARVFLYGGENTIIDCSSVSYLASEAVSSTAKHYKHTIKSYESWIVPWVSSYYPCPKTITTIPEFTMFVDENDEPVRMSEACDPSTLVLSTETPIPGNPDGGVDTQFQLAIPDGYDYLKNKTFSNGVYGHLYNGWGTVQFSVQSSNSNFLNCTQLSRTVVSPLNYNLTSYLRDYCPTLNYVLYNVATDEDRVYYDNSTGYLYSPKRVKELKLVETNNVGTQKARMELDNACMLYNIRFANAPMFLAIQASPTYDSHVVNCEFINCTGTGVEWITNTYTTTLCIKNCRFKNCGITGGHSIMCDPSWHVAAMSSVTFDSKLQVEGCNITRDDICYYQTYTGRNAIDLSCIATVTGNIISNMPGPHMYLRYGQITASNNEIFNTAEFNKYPLRNYNLDNAAIYVAYLYKMDTESYDNTSSFPAIGSSDTVYEDISSSSDVSLRTGYGWSSSANTYFELDLDPSHTEAYEKTMEYLTASGTGNYTALHNDSIGYLGIPHYVELSYNKIHDISMIVNEGIYIDDGRGDVDVKYNTVLGTTDWCITARKKNAQNKWYLMQSIRVNYIGNIISGPYTLVHGDGVTGANRPITRNNIILSTNSCNVSSDNVIAAPDIIIQNYKISENLVLLPPEYSTDSSLDPELRNIMRYDSGLNLASESTGKVVEIKTPLNYTQANQILGPSSSNTGKIYKIYDTINLENNAFTLAYDCVLDFQGGRIINSAGLNIHGLTVYNGTFENAHLYQQSGGMYLYNSTFRYTQYKPSISGLVTLTGFDAIIKNCTLDCTPSSINSGATNLGINCIVIESKIPTSAEKPIGNESLLIDGCVIKYSMYGMVIGGNASNPPYNGNFKICNNTFTAYEDADYMWYMTAVVFSSTQKGIIIDNNTFNINRIGLNFNTSPCDGLVISNNTFREITYSDASLRKDYIQCIYAINMPFKSVVMTGNVFDFSTSFYDVTGSNSGQSYTLATALVAVPNEYRDAKTSITFYSSDAHDYQFWFCTASAWTTNTSDWRLAPHIYTLYTYYGNLVFNDNHVYDAGFMMFTPGPDSSITGNFSVLVDGNKFVNKFYAFTSVDVRVKKNDMYSQTVTITNNYIDNKANPFVFRSSVYTNVDNNIIFSKYTTSTFEEMFYTAETDGLFLLAKNNVRDNVRGCGYGYSGVSAKRPSPPLISDGFCYFDTSLGTYGKPIYATNIAYNPSTSAWTMNWVNADGVDPSTHQSVVTLEPSGLTIDVVTTPPASAQSNTIYIVHS